MKNRTSEIWKINKNDLQSLIDNSNSKVEVLKKLNVNAYNGNHRTLNKRIKEDNLDLSKLHENQNQWRIKFNKKYLKKYLNKRKSNNEVFIKNSTYGNRHLKRRIIKENLISYKCDICGNEGKWNNNKLVLALDHKNGINNDSRLENLRFLCPNCHSQTDTFSGKNKFKKPLAKCPMCGDSFGGLGKTCRKCWTQNQPKKLIITKLELEKLIKNDKLSYEAIGRMYKVCGNTIKKRCIKWNIKK